MPDKLADKFYPPCWRFTIAGIIDFSLCAIFFITFSSLLSSLYDSLYEVPPPEPMSLFNENQARAYSHGLLALIVFIFFNSVICNLSKLKASIGKAIVGIALVNSSGNKISFKQSFIRFLVIILYFSIITMPGPIVGFAFGIGSEIFSNILLLVGIGIVIRLSVYKGKSSGRPYQYSAPNIYPVLRKQIQDFQQEAK